MINAYWHQRFQQNSSFPPSVTSKLRDQRLLASKVSTVVQQSGQQTAWTSDQRLLASKVSTETQPFTREEVQM